MASTRVVKWGNSLAIRIPKVVAHEARVSAGNLMEIEAEDGCIHCGAADERYPR
jgi:antitoxin component of MazEF toxin-antitoxin module